MYPRNITAPLLPIAASLILGIVAGHWLMPTFPLVTILASMVMLAIACYKWAVVQSVAVCGCFVVLGMTLAQLRWADRGVTADNGQTVEGVVMSEPAEKPRTIGIDLFLPTEGNTIRCYLLKDGHSRNVRLGDVLTVTLDHQLEGRASNMFFVRSSSWNYGGDALQKLSRWERTRLWFLHQRHRLLATYRDTNADEPLYAVLAAMTLGDKSALSSELRDTYAVSGASHILALSGLHLSIVYALLTWLTLRRRRFWLSQLVLVSNIWAFAFLTGLSPSVTRAATMFSLNAIFAVRSHRLPTLNVLAFAAIAMLVADAGTLFDIGFQMSFTAVASILVGIPLVERLWCPRHRLIRWAWALVGVSVCAQLGVAPLVAYHFGRLPTYFLLTNFIVVPAATIILYGALVAFVFPPAFTPLLWLVGRLNDALQFIASLPYSSINGLHPSVVQTVACYVLLALVCRALYILLPKR
ncbi:MAG: ComEC/Rec2 family competence protein [Prevotella sp.]|nr:ComEC/Rec2 family competence protein [Prevotella sp.]